MVPQDRASGRSAGIPSPRTAHTRHLKHSAFQHLASLVPGTWGSVPGPKCPFKFTCDLSSPRRVADDLRDTEGLLKKHVPESFHMSLSNAPD